MLAVVGSLHMSAAGLLIRHTFHDYPCYYNYCVCGGMNSQLVELKFILSAEYCKPIEMTYDQVVLYFILGFSLIAQKCAQTVECIIFGNCIGFLFTV